MTKKIARYLNWLQHDTRIFNVGERRRVATGAPSRLNTPGQPSECLDRNGGFKLGVNPSSLNGILHKEMMLDPPAQAAKILINGQDIDEDLENGGALPPPAMASGEPEKNGSDHLTSSADLMKAGGLTVNTDCEEQVMEQTADFFNPKNTKAAQLREEVALATLDELLDYILDEGGSVGIFDATNSTLQRRKMIMNRIRERAGPELGVLFLESLCLDQNVGRHMPDVTSFKALIS